MQCTSLLFATLTYLFTVDNVRTESNTIHDIEVNSGTSAETIVENQTKKWIQLAKEWWL